MSTEFERVTRKHLLKEIRSLDEPPVPDLPPDHYIAVGGNYPLYLRYYSDSSYGDKWWFVELVIDYDTHDHLLTFGPLSRADLIEAVKALVGTYCTIYENWDRSYISDKLRLQEEKKAEDAKPAQ